MAPRSANRPPLAGPRLQPLPVDDPIGAEIGVPMGVELARRRPGLCSIDCV